MEASRERSKEITLGTLSSFFIITAVVVVLIYQEKMIKGKDIVTGIFMPGDKRDKVKV